MPDSVSFWRHWVICLNGCGAGTGTFSDSSSTASRSKRWSSARCRLMPRLHRWSDIRLGVISGFRDSEGHYSSTLDSERRQATLKCSATPPISLPWERSSSKLDFDTRLDPGDQSITYLQNLNYEFCRLEADSKPAEVTSSRHLTYMRTGGDRHVSGSSSG